MGQKAQSKIKGMVPGVAHVVVCTSFYMEALGSAWRHVGAKRMRLLDSDGGIAESCRDVGRIARACRVVRWR